MQQNLILKTMIYPSDSGQNIFVILQIHFFFKTN